VIKWLPGPWVNFPGETSTIPPPRGIIPITFSRPQHARLSRPSSLKRSKYPTGYHLITAQACHPGPPGCLSTVRTSHFGWGLFPLREGGVTLGHTPPQLMRFPPFPRAKNPLVQPTSPSAKILAGGITSSPHHSDHPSCSQVRPKACSVLPDAQPGPNPSLRLVPRVIRWSRKLNVGSKRRGRGGANARRTAKEKKGLTLRFLFASFPKGA